MSIKYCCLVTLFKFLSMVSVNFFQFFCSCVSRLRNSSFISDIKIICVLDVIFNSQHNNILSLAIMNGCCFKFFKLVDISCGLFVKLLVCTVQCYVVPRFLLTSLFKIIFDIGFEARGDKLFLKEVSH